jgi:carboxymethylenebutenolidase
MNFTAMFPFQKAVSAAALALAMAAGPVAPQTATAAGLTDLLAGLCITEGCSSFTGPYGSPVPVKYFLPKCDSGAPAVILLHGSDGGTKYNDDYEEIGKGLAAEGYAAFLVYYYEGAPGEPRPGPNDRGLPNPTAFIPWTATVEQAVSYVQSFPCVNPARVGLMGMSLGGFIGASVAVNDARVRSLVVLSGGMPDLYAQQMRAMPPTLIVHGDQDTDVPVAAAYQLRQQMASRGLWHDLVILPCEGHLPYRTYKETVAKKVLAFFNQTL